MSEVKLTKQNKNHPITNIEKKIENHYVIRQYVKHEIKKHCFAEKKQLKFQ